MIDFRRKEHTDRIKRLAGGGPQDRATSKGMRGGLRGGPLRDVSICTELHVSKLQLRCDSYAESEHYSSRQHLLVKNVEIRDKLESSNKHKLLYHYGSDDAPKLSGKPMVRRCCCCCCIKFTH